MSWLIYFPENTSFSILTLRYLLTTWTVANLYHRCMCVWVVCMHACWMYTYLLLCMYVLFCFLINWGLPVKKELASNKDTKLIVGVMVLKTLTFWTLEKSCTLLLFHWKTVLVICIWTSWFLFFSKTSDH